MESGQCHRDSSDKLLVACRKGSIHCQWETSRRAPERYGTELNFEEIRLFQVVGTALAKEQRKREIL